MVELKTKRDLLMANAKKTANTKWRYGKFSRIGPLIVNAITPICQQNGFMQARILLEWDSIIPSDFSRFCMPVKVSFPPKKRSEGRLVVRATSSMATELAYWEQLILSRINQYFGYQAIDKIVILQGPVSIKTAPAKRAIKTLSAETLFTLEDCTKTIPHELLRNALYDLGKSIAGDKG
jgi:hypothetical protein